MAPLVRDAGRGAVGSRSAMLWRLRWMLAGLGLVAAPLVASHALAQTPAPPASAQDAAAVTADEVARHLAVLGHDSLQHRTTPSPALERAAAYVAAQLQQAGLAPGSLGTDSWLQQYRLPRQLRLDPGQSKLLVTAVLHAGDHALSDERGQLIYKQVAVDFATTARFMGRVVPTFDWEERRRTVLVTGRHTPASLRGADLQGCIALYAPPAGTDADQTQRILDQLAASSHGVVLLSPADSTQFAAEVEAARRVPVPVAEDYLMEQAGGRWQVQVWPGALREVLATAGLEWSRLWTDTMPVVRPLPFTQFGFHPAVDTNTVTAGTAPNVVGVLEGSDPRLKRQPLLLLAHLDQRGPRRPRLSDDSAAVADPDTTADEPADDGTVGVAGLLALARAFSQLEVRPRRPLLFLAVSGGHDDFWGSRAFLYPRLTYESINGPAPALVLALDLAGRGARDSLVITGLRDVVLATRPEAVALTHADLDLEVQDGGGTAFRSASDAAAFARSGVPSLRIAQRRRPGAAPGDSPTPLVDAETTARILRLVFYLTRELADADPMPRWSAEGRRQFLRVEK